MKKIYIVEEQITEYVFDEWDDFDTTYYNNVVGYTDSLKEAEFIRDNYGTDYKIVINEYPYLNKEILIEKQRYYKYWFNIELKRVGGHFRIYEVGKVEKEKIFNNAKKDIKFNELNLQCCDDTYFNKNKISVYVKLYLLGENEEAFVHLKKDSLVQKIQFLLKHSMKADIRNKKEIMKTIEKLGE
ncbi:hypothetical protein PCV68_001009 [Staphylococcus pseudintermedius]|nr:hypothetical protein [Staphylococcus pseudintermedius]